MPVIAPDVEKNPRLWREHVVQAAAVIPVMELDELIDELQAARAQRSQASPAENEADLLAQINHGLSQPEWKRFHELRDRRRAETATEDELAELRQLVDKMEALNVERIAALIRLSRLRGVSLLEQMETLGIKSPGYV